MRITTGMLNRKQGGGLISSRKSLLNYVQSNRTGGSSRLSAMGAVGSSSALKRTERTKYEKLADRAEELISAGNQLMTGVDGGSSEIAADTQKLVDAYNGALDSLGDATGVLNQYYLQMLKQTVSDNRTELAEIGIDVSGGGKLTLDKEKLAKADGELVKKLLGSGGGFAKRAVYVAGRVSENAQVNVQNLSNQYDSRGSITNSYLSRYYFRG